jgi:ribosomal protein L15
MALSNLGMDHNRKIAREEAGEMAQLRDLERKMNDGKLTPAEKREKLLPLKLEKSLLLLAAAGGDKTVEVRVILSDFSDDALAKLTAIGFKVLAKATNVKLVIGTIAADKLEALALLEVVRHVAPADS